MQSLIDAVAAGELHAEISLVVASKDGIGAIARAEKAGIPVAVFSKNGYPSLDEMFVAVIEQLRVCGVEYVVLAGYLSILTPNIVRAFENRIINIHPSLIPKFCGDGFYGMRVHRAVIAARETESGATVHLVDEGTDTGRILAQARVPVLDGDTPEMLQARVLEAEHRLLPSAVEAYVNRQ